MRTRNAAAAAANPATPTTPTAATPNGHGHSHSHSHARNLSGTAPFEMTARSPPNPSAATKSMYFYYTRCLLYRGVVFLFKRLC